VREVGSDASGWNLVAREPQSHDRGMRARAKQKVEDDGGMWE